MENIYKYIVEYQVNNTSQDTDVHTPRGVLKASKDTMYGKGEQRKRETPYANVGLMDKNVARKLFNPLFYLPLQLFEKMNKKFAFTVAAK